MERFASQDSTTDHLEKMKDDSEQHKAKLTDEKTRLNKEFEEMKYSGEAKTSKYENLCFKNRISSPFTLVVNVFLMKLKKVLMKATNDVKIVHKKWKKQ